MPAPAVTAAAAFVVVAAAAAAAFVAAMLQAATMLLLLSRVMGGEGRAVIAGLGLDCLWGVCLGPVLACLGLPRPGLDRLGVPFHCLLLLLLLRLLL